METRPLGNSGLRVPVVGMGTWQTFDVRGTDAESNARKIVDAALAGGANFFDDAIHFRLVAIEDFDGSALTGEEAGDGEADSGCTSGNDGGLGVKFWHAF